MAIQLQKHDLEPLILGAAFFGSGGGGTIISARSLLKHFESGSYYPTTSVEVVSVEEATEGETVMGAYMGAPEAIDSAQYPIGPVAAAEAAQEACRRNGKKLAYIVSPESGALGFLVACLVAARLGLKVIDADGAGRAVPSLPMLTYAAAGISPRPTFLVAQSGLKVELDVTPAQGEEGDQEHQQNVSVIVEQMLRPILGQQSFGEFGGLAMWLMSPQQLPGALPIRGTLMRALKLGYELAEGRLTSTRALQDWLYQHCDIRAYALADETSLLSAEVDTSGGFDLGKVCLSRGQDSVTVLFQNESLLAWSSERASPLTIAPDTISYFSPGAGQQVFSNGDILLPDGSINPVAKDRRFAVLAWEAEPALRQPGGLIMQSFAQALAKIGFLGGYTPVGQLDQQQGV